MRKAIGALAALLVLVTLIIAGCSSGSGKFAGTEAVIYRSSSCGCCSAFGSYLQGKGYQVKSVTQEYLAPIKKQYGVPPSLETCHTTVIGGYFIEGHVPVEAIEKLLAEKPDIKGIGLPGMPSASPGMPGSKQGPFTISAVQRDGRITPFMVI
ncbi:MAG TPA: DUF411 domain-containing protein [Candidatus Nanoarchaeia archaeon]|nr:DUF411 domain-containing protein [Candidatus Nanoarchaeia archaeon]